MNKMLFKMGLGVLALASLALPSYGAATGMKTLYGHVPAVVSKLTPTGDVSDTNTLHLAIGLPLRNQNEVKTLVQQVSDPSSPNYRNYLSTEEFTAKFGPTADDVKAVTDFAQASGLTIKRVHTNNLLIEVEGKPSDVERAFNVKLHTYHLASENRDFYAPDQEPTVSTNLPVLDVQGLDNYNHPHPRIHVGPNKATKLGSGPYGNYIGSDFRNAYVPGTTLNGSGQKVALLEFDGYLASDISAYEQLIGYSPVTLTNVLLQGFSGAPTQFGGQGEVTLDIDMVIDMAPSINEILVYEEDPQTGLPNVILSQMAMDNSARQISCSWGWGGGPSGTTDEIFEQMILQGQTFYDASGDVCAFLPPGQPGSVDDPTLPNAPSDDPYITQVGATTLQTKGPGGAFVAESVWNWGNEFPGQGYDGVGSSGGISGYYAIPTWQQGISMANNQGSTTMRNLPDVGMPGDNIYIIVNGAAQPDTGGTSCAAPLWAGFTALVNQQAAEEGLGAIGFINPALYSLAKTANYTNYFHDVVLGNNTWSQSPNDFYAVSNYDLCDGLGSPNGTNLINALATATYAPVVYTPVIPAPQQPWGTNLTFMDGGDPNGLWLLYYRDENQTLGGTNYNGWMVNLTTANPVGFPADNELYVSSAINGHGYGNATNVNATPGSSWQTTLSVTNYGPALSSNVYVVDTMPTSPGVTLVSSNSTVAGSSIAIVGSKLIWLVGNLTNSAGGSLITGGSLTLNFSANDAGLYTNSATVGATTTDPNPDDDSVLVIATVAASAPPAITPQLLSVGGTHGLQLSITNDSGSQITIQASTNLVTWVPVYTNYAPLVFTNFDDTNYQRRFYRAVVDQ